MRFVFYKKVIFFIPVIISFYLFFTSPNIFDDIGDDNLIIEGDSNLIDSLRIWKNSQLPESLQDEKQKSVDRIFQDSINNFNVFFCILDGNTVKLIPVEVDLSSNEENRIEELLNFLFDKPAYLDNRYHTLIPDGTRLLGYRIDGDTVVVDLNDNFLNTVSGDDGKKLKIAQVVYTLDALKYIRNVSISIDGEYVSFLDRDGTVENKIFNVRNISNIIYYD